MLGQAGIAIEAIERVVFSHWHTDHCLDLYALIFARRNPACAAAPHLDLIGPRGLRSRVERAPELLGSWVEDRDHSITELVADANGCIAFERGVLEGVGHENGHMPHAVSWRFVTEQGMTLCYSGDSGEVEALVRAARGSDLFLCECSLDDELAVEHHLTPSSAGRVAEEAGVGRLVLTHFYPDLEPQAAAAGAAEHFSGEICLAADGAAFELG